jgi:hypothetical protein
MAGLTPWEKEAYEKVQALEQTSVTRWNVYFWSLTAVTLSVKMSGTESGQKLRRYHNDQGSRNKRKSIK